MKGVLLHLVLQDNRAAHLQAVQLLSLQLGQLCPIELVRRVGPGRTATQLAAGIAGPHRAGAALILGQAVQLLTVMMNDVILRQVSYVTSMNACQQNL